MNSESKSAVPAAITLAANRLELASMARRPVLPVRALIGDADIDAAYAVQEELNARRIATGAVVVGRKIGLTSPAVQRQLGVDQPDFGVLFADMDVSTNPLVPSERLLQPKAEAEIAFVLKHDLDSDVLSEEPNAFGHLAATPSGGTPPSWDAVTVSAGCDQRPSRSRPMSMACPVRAETLRVPV